MTKPKVVLYNPRADFYTIPLALLAVGSSLDRERYDVRIVDGRLERDAVPRLIAECEGAVCLGVTVLTGTPIRDALRVSRLVKQALPDCPIVWGGWHPSLFPAAALEEPSVDAVIIGQGEETFAGVVDRLCDGGSLRDVAGCAFAESAAGLAAGARAVVVNPSRPARDINLFAGHDYSLIPVERYFGLKGQRQLDYVSSQGCRFRCSFCADPTVYRRAWFGLSPQRVGQELERLWQRYRFEDLGFQDETFFTHADRVAAIADEILRRDLHFTWMATMRADQGFRTDEAVLAQCRRAGLRRVMIGLESGSQDTLDWMKKDIRIDHVFDAAEKCRRQGIALLFNLIVGFPGESPESVAATLAVAKRLRGLGPECQLAIFYYTPYPGTEITEQLRQQGHAFPAALEDWASMGEANWPGPWVQQTTVERIEGFRFYQQIGWAKPTPWRRPIQAVARWRCRQDCYGFPIEKALVEWLRPSTARS